MKQRGFCKMTPISPDDLNYMIFRYFKESGYMNSAISLGSEVGIQENNIDGDLLPPRLLITVVQKGIEYVELEAKLSNDDLNFDLITKNGNEFKRNLKEKIENILKEKSKGKAKEIIESGQEKEATIDLQPEALVTFVQKGIQHLELEAKLSHDDLETDGDFQFRHPFNLIKKYVSELQRIKIENTQKDKSKGKQKENIESGQEHGSGLVMELAQENGNKRQQKEEAVGDMERTKKEKRDIETTEKEATTLPSLPCEFPNSDVTALQGHTSEVFACAWNPTGPLLASGSEDSTARIWNMDDPSSSSSVLQHFEEVSSLDWNSDGTLLATGSVDGKARIWSKDGRFIRTLDEHEGSIFSLKWNKQRDFLLGMIECGTVIVWDAKTGRSLQRFPFNLGPIDCFDWRNSLSFATCHFDRVIHVCGIGSNFPIKTFAGHKQLVNSTMWDPTGTLLASGSDDCTVKIWTMEKDECLLDFKEHSQKVFSVRWSPTGPGTNNPNQPCILASASFDSTVKLWDVDAGRLLYSLDGHGGHPVSDITFSPNGEYLTSRSRDGVMHIWSVKESRIVRSLTGICRSFVTCWNKEGNKIAVPVSNNRGRVTVVDFRM